MKRLSWVAVVIALLADAAPAMAHPVPFSYLDVRVQPQSLDVTLIAHMFDLAHDLKVEAPERFLEPAFVATRREEILGLFTDRLRFAADGRPMRSVVWSEVQVVPDRQSVQLRGQLETTGRGTLTARAAVFPYDPAHQTFVNFYEGETLTLQAILDGTKTDIEYFPGSVQGALAVLRRFVPVGVRHVLAGLDHWLFLAGLLMLGWTSRRAVAVVCAFLAADLVTLTLVTLNLMHPPTRLVDPAIALSIVYVGADNLMVGGGRDMRGWMALAFGLIHGFWFPSVLAQMDMPRRALGWSLVSFEVGAEVGQWAIVGVLAICVAAVHARGTTASQRLVRAGSMAVIAAGAYLFVRRVFFPGGIF